MGPPSPVKMGLLSLLKVNMQHLRAQPAAIFIALVRNIPPLGQVARHLHTDMGYSWQDGGKIMGPSPIVPLAQLWTSHLLMQVESSHPQVTVLLPQTFSPRHIIAPITALQYWWPCVF